MAVIPDRRRTGVSAELVLSPGRVDVARDEEIEVAVTVDIEERAARAPQRGIGAARVRYSLNRPRPIFRYSTFGPTLVTCKSIRPSLS